MVLEQARQLFTSLATEWFEELNLYGA